MKDLNITIVSKKHHSIKNLVGVSPISDGAERPSEHIQFGQQDREFRDSEKNQTASGDQDGAATPRYLFNIDTPCFDYSANTRCQTPNILVRNVFFFIFFFYFIAWFGILCGNFFFFLDQRLIWFVRENYCNCASCGKFRTNEFFKHAYEISKSRPHKRIFDARK
jgi:hypothetical protein